MLERLILENFQAHEKLVIKFGEGVTTIVGRSDRGKSAVIRALGCVALNSPSGVGIIRHGAARLRVGLVFDGGRVCVRTRSKDTNLYRLDKAKFSAFGTKVPDPISEALKIGEENFQFQFDGHYWFSDTNAAVGKKLNELVDLELIDKMMGSIASQVRSKTAEVKVLKGQLESAVAKKESLKHVLPALKDLKRLEAKKREHEETIEKRSLLLAKLKTLAVARNTAKLAGEAANIGVELTTAGESLLKIARDSEKLKNLLRNLRTVQQITKLPAPDDFDKILAVRKEADKVAENHRVLRQAVARYETADEELEQCRRNLAKLEKELAKHPVCPSCKKPL